jgi:probable O-glycosylation ligase (exosortase A-associated)
MRTLTLLLTYYGCALYALSNPFFGLLFYIHITIFRPESLVWGNLAFGRLHMATACITLIAYFLQYRLYRINYRGDFQEDYQKKNLITFVCYIAWFLIVSALAESSVELSLNKTIEVIKIFLLCFLFAKLVNKKDRIELYVWVTSISFGLLSFWGFLQSLGGNSRLDTLWPGGSNYIAVQLSLMAPFVLAKVFDRTLSFWYKLIFLACTLSIVLCSISTNSRSGFLGLSIGMIIFVLQIKQRFKVLSGLAIIFLLVYPWITDTYSDRITSIYSAEEERDESSGSRLVLWRIALRIWQDHPIAGVGLENFSPVKEMYLNQVSDIVTSEKIFNLIFNQERRPHGLYPGMLAETGLIGLGLFIFLLCRGICCRFPSLFVKDESERSLYLQVKGAQSGLIGFAVGAFFGDFQYIEMLYLQIFFIGAIYDYANSMLDLVDMKKA